MRIRLKIDIKGVSFDVDGPVDGKPFFFAKGTEGTVVTVSRSFCEEDSEWYHIKMDAYRSDVIIAVSTRCVDFIDKAVNKKSIKINMFREKI